MSDERKKNFQEKKNALLAKRENNSKNRIKLEKLLASFGAVTVLASGMTAEAQENKSNTSAKQDNKKTTMIERASSDSLFDKKIDKMTADFDEVMKGMDKEFQEKTKSMEKEFNEKTQGSRTSQSMTMRGGLIVEIQDENGKPVEFKKDIENDSMTRNILDQVIKGKMDADNRYSHSFVMQDVAKMVYDLNNNPTEFDKAVNRQMKGVKTRTEKDGSTSFIYTNKDNQTYKLANFSKEVSEKNPAIKRIQTNEAINQKAAGKTR
ncbi:MAG: hypothetical protein ACK5N8_03550 [Alphaproteobacteria bacterium]